MRLWKCFVSPLLFFCIWGRREILLSLCGSPTQRLRRLFGRLASSFMNIHPGIICLSGRRRRLLASVGWCELPHNHNLTFSYGAAVAVELTVLLSRALRCPYTTTEGPGSTQQMRNLLCPPRLFIFRTLFFNAGRSRLS